MEKKFEETFNQLVHDVRIDTLKEVSDLLWKKEESIMKLLSNGLPIFETSYGKRFTKLNNARNKLYRKADYLIKLNSEIDSLRFKD